MNEKYVVNIKLTVKEVISHMETVSITAVVVLDDSQIIRGLFSNGDMRRFFLKGGNLSANITEAMNDKPLIFLSVQEVENYRRKKHLIIYPIADKGMHLLDILLDNDIEKENFCSNELTDIPLVIMAGGKGTRLYPYTKILPKALIPIGEETISERIIDNFRKYGCKEVFFILNHKAAMIKAYFNELDVNYSIKYIEEKNFLGTGGGLRLLKGMVNGPFFLSNCDIIINADLACAYKTHKMNRNVITFVCALKEMKIPYGVVETSEEGKIKKIIEKPEYSFLTNTGLYIVEPEVINSIRDDEFIHMPDIAQRYITEGFNVGVFPVSDAAWLDMGQINEMEEMLKNFEV